MSITEVVNVSKMLIDKSVGSEESIFLEKEL